MIQIVLGPDREMARRAVDGLVRVHDPAGQNTTVIDGRTASVADVTTRAGAVGFFGEPRVLVVQDLLSRWSRGDSEGDDAPKAAMKGFDIAALFAAIPAVNVLILTDPNLASVPAAVKKVLPPDATVTAGEPPRGPALLAWLARIAAAAGASLDQATARHLADHLFPKSWASKPTNARYDRPPDLELARNEVEKLAAAANFGQIERRHIDALSPRGEQDRLFPFTDAVAQGRLPAALAELDRLLAEGDEPYRLTAQLYQQAEMRFALATAGPRRDPVAVGRDLGLPNPARMSSIAANRRSRDDTDRADRELLTRMLATERMMKSGGLRRPEDVIYHLVTGQAIPGRDEGGT
ncbi:MAG: hypothetical protein M3P94_02015 [Chloroflexota bacterium]|nr:hypothetical protein [Chloroflexota bacterium]